MNETTHPAHAALAAAVVATATAEHAVDAGHGHAEVALVERLDGARVAEHGARVDALAARADAHEQAVLAATTAAVAVVACERRFDQERAPLMVALRTAHAALHVAEREHRRAVGGQATVLSGGYVTVEQLLVEAERAHAS